ncbi:MAG: hypothetical protein LBK13_06940 [Spirochaetales bacterium]|nr:hypothetical protein [Spirochaetales bacterium]
MPVDSTGKKCAQSCLHLWLKRALEKGYNNSRVSVKTELYQTVKAYSIKTRNPAVDYESFVAFIDKYAGKHSGDLPDLFAARGADFSGRIMEAFRQLEEEKYVFLQKTANRIHIIKVPAGYADFIERIYARIIPQGDSVFPSPETVGIPIDPDLLVHINVQTDFETYLAKEPPNVPELVNISFPNLSKTLIVTSKLMEKPLIEISLHKIRCYLREQKNAQYLQHKLLPLFPQREATLKTLIVNAVTKSDLTLQEFMVPSDQTFQFWTQVSSMLLKEYGPKADKLEEEIDLCIACNIVNFYAVYFKGVTQKARESDESLKILAQQFTKPPYAFTFHDIYSFKDVKGNPIVKRIDRTVFAVYLEQVTTPKDGAGLPELLKIRMPDKTEYFIRSGCIIKLLMSRVYFLAKNCKTHFIAGWAGSLKNNQKLPAMVEDVNFVKEIENYVKVSDPVFCALLNFNLLFLLKDQTAMPPVEMDFLNGLLNIRAKSLTSIEKIMGLSRQAIYREARLRLPFWMIIPVFSSIVQFFINLLSSRGGQSSARKKKENEAEGLSSGEDQPVRKARYREEIDALISHYIKSAEDIPREMNALVSLWNPLLDPRSKQNLVEDVNSLVRDFLRVKKYRTRFSCPSIAEVDKLGRELSENRNLEAIRDRTHLREYIVLYMLKILHKV